MKIRLINFLCYTDTTYDFGDKGMVLITGQSGKGKSSIFRGIYFALFGEGNKLSKASGSSSGTKVDLYYKDYIISRTKRPNRLVVTKGDSIYEDAIAQGVVNELVGTTFKTSGYIQQNALSSFIVMSPSDKLAFIEKFAFSGVDMEAIKSRAKVKMGECNTNLTRKTTELETKECMLRELEGEVVYPLKNKGENAIKNEEIRYKNTNTLISRNTKTKDNLTREHTDSRLLENTLSTYEDEIFHLGEKLWNVKLNLEKIHPPNMQRGEELDTELQGILEHREYTTLRDKLRDMYHRERKKMESDISSLRESLWNEYKKDEIVDILSDQIECRRDLAKIEDLESLFNQGKNDKVIISKYENDLSNRKRELSELNESLDRVGVHICPNCDKSLKFVKGNLTIVNVTSCGDNEEDISEEELRNLIQKKTRQLDMLQQNIEYLRNKVEKNEEAKNEIDRIQSKYESVLPSLEELDEDIEYLRQYKIRENERENSLNKLVGNFNNDTGYSASYMSIKARFDELEDEERVVSDRNEEDIRKELLDHKENVRIFKTLQQEKALLENKIRDYESKCDKLRIKHKTAYADCRSPENIQGEIDEITTTLKKLEIKNKEHKNNLHMIGEWKKYESLRKSIKILTGEKQEAMNSHTGILSLNTSILEAESIAIQNIVDTINTHATYYLDCFFTDEPIHVHLESFKTTKKGTQSATTKPCINVVIEYKGMECDLSMLSGGELSRVVLSYTLALAEMFNTPFLMLDECTASLDQDLTSDVFDAIREHYASTSDNLVLIIAHQVVSGTFDKMITI
jgi:exonuclease SbcC